MKKIILTFSLLCMCFSLFAVEISLGGYVGGEVNKVAGSKNGFPQFGVVLDFEFKNVGLQTSFGFDFRLKKIRSEKENKNFKNFNFREFIFISPYYPFHHKRFTFTLGPSLGFKFEQANWERPEKKEHHFYIICGGNFETRYEVSEHAKVFLNLGVFTDTGSMHAKNEMKGEAKPKDPFKFDKASLYFVPKLGVVYTF